MFSQGQVDSRTVQRLSLLADKERLTGGGILARSFSQALMARSSSLRNGCVVDNPPFNLATYNTRLSVSLDQASTGTLPGIHAETLGAKGNGRVPRCGCPWPPRSAVHLAAGQVLAVTAIVV